MWAADLDPDRSQDAFIGALLGLYERAGQVEALALGPGGAPIASARDTPPDERLVMAWLGALYTARRIRALLDQLEPAPESLRTEAPAVALRELLR